MKKIKIAHSNHPLYKAFRELYVTSFPIFEQRTEPQQKSAFSCEKYHLISYYDEENFVGFIAYWEFDNYLYIEHLAINTSLRGKGYGSQLLNDFISSTSKIVLLEIDPVIDEISEARLRFYKKCGFYSNPYLHSHPAYRVDYPPHTLIVLTTQRPITATEYEQFSHDLNSVVMKFL
ncbi:GNAT family N-acetyltransferase [Capnocytophaga canimorsus]|uniref:GNAT family N-acetyltransferase n=1 Tax=Capnocytophaga canimorsus TaxID=28188 RepID=UPI00384DF26F